MKSKSAEETARIFRKMIQKQMPQKTWTDKGTEFKGAFKKLCDQGGIETLKGTLGRSKTLFINIWNTNGLTIT